MRMPMHLHLFAVLASAAQFDVRPAANANIDLFVEKTGFLKGKVHHFTLDRYSAAVDFDSASPNSATVNLTIEAASIVCRDTWVSAKDLKKVQAAATNDMLAAARFPQITFRSVSVRATGSAKYEVTGTLTIRNVEKPVKVDVELVPSEDGALHVKGEARVRLTDFGLKPPSAALGTVGTKDEMELRFTLIGMRRS